MAVLENVSWKMTTVVTTVVAATIVAMWNIFGALASYTDKMDDTDTDLNNRVTTLESTRLDDDALISYENRITGVEKDVEWIKKDHHKEGK